MPFRMPKTQCKVWWDKGIEANCGHWAWIGTVTDAGAKLDLSFGESSRERALNSQ